MNIQWHIHLMKIALFIGTVCNKRNTMKMDTQLLTLQVESIP